MWRFFQRLRSEPEEDRKRAVFILSFGLISVIFIFWVVSFVSLKLEPLGKSDLINNYNQAEKKDSPLKEIKGFMSEIVDVFKNGFNQTANSINNINDLEGLIKSNQVEILPESEIMMSQPEVIEPEKPVEIKNLDEIYFE